MAKIICIFVGFMLVSGAPALSQSRTPSFGIVTRLKAAIVQFGTASYYHNKFNGRKTANGEIHNQQKLTAAHNGLPLGTWVRVTNLSNHKMVIVKIIDRLHHRNRRLIDLSKAAATKLNYFDGLLKVKVEILGKSRPVGLSSVSGD